MIGLTIRDQVTLLILCLCGAVGLVMFTSSVEFLPPDFLNIYTIVSVRALLVVCFLSLTLNILLQCAVKRRGGEGLSDALTHTYYQTTGALLMFLFSSSSWRII